MRTRLLSIVLYGPSTQPRVIDFHESGLSVVTGWSKTGKSSLISIVDYCLGASTFDVPEGPIRQLVDWYGLRLRIGDQHVFVARRVPEAGSQTSGAAYLQIGSELAIPPPDRVDATTNVDAVVQVLTSMIGIRDYVHEPLPGQTRNPVPVNFRHGLYFCFQSQDEIISRKHLFHRQSEPFIPQTIKDVLPYFLGAVDDDYMIRKAEHRRLLDRLKKLTRRHQEMLALRGEGSSRAQHLLAEAADLGVLMLPAASDAISWSDAVEALRRLASTPVPEILEPSQGGAGDVYRRLVEQDGELRRRFERVRQDRDTAASLLRHHGGYASEGYHQVARLRAIGVYPSVVGQAKCPLCESQLGEEHPTHNQIQRVADRLGSTLSNVAASVPHLTRLVEQFDGDLDSLRGQLRDNRRQLDELQKASERVQTYRDHVARIAHLQGRTSLYLENLPETSDEPDRIKREMDELSRAAALLEARLNPEAIEEHVESALVLISDDITDGGRKLNLEYADQRLRLDRRRITLVADTRAGPVPMERIGSGANWVGYHIVVFLALHRWFTQQDRPVPGFVFFDQPSQIGFPADTVEHREKDADREAVRRMMRLIAEFSSNEDAPFQVIVTEHADLNEPWFQDRVVAVWRDGDALIPREWFPPTNKGEAG